MNFLKIAKVYHASGLHVIPVNEDKTPRCKWKQYIEKQTEKDIENLFKSDCHGIALLCTDGLEVIDIDLKYDITGRLQSEYSNLVLEAFGNERSFFEELTIQATVSGGLHLIYRTKNGEGNQKLSSRFTTDEERKESPNEKVKVLIETRGEGGYILIAPSPKYSILTNSLTNIQEITREERDILITCGRAFDESEPVEQKPEIEKEFQSDGLKCWDDFNQRSDLLALLESHGWSIIHSDSKRAYLRRPGKNKGLSGNYHKDLNLFKSWSTSSEFEAEKAYTPFAAYAVLKHNGDFSKAAKALYQDGYGERIKKVEREEKDMSIIADKIIKEEPKEKENLVTKFFSEEWKYGEKVKEPDPNFWVNIEDEDGMSKSYPISAQGMMGAVIGQAKSRKTTTLKGIIGSALGNIEVINFNYRLPKGKKIVMIDTEQGRFWFQKMCDGISQIAGFDKHPDHFRAFNLRGYNKKERVYLINEIVKRIGNIGLLIIDGVVDLCDDMNNSTKSQETIGHLMRWSDVTQATLITVLHTNKPNGNFSPSMRGHLGTELKNKSDFIIEVVKDSETPTISEVKCNESRFLPFHEFFMTMDEDGKPRLPHEEKSIQMQIVIEPQKYEQNKMKPTTNDADIPF